MSPGAPVTPPLPGGCLALEPVEPAAQAEGPSTHGAGPGGGGVHAQGPSTSWGWPSTQRHGRGAGVCSNTDLPPMCWP